MKTKPQNKSQEESTWLTYMAETPPESFIKGYEAAEDDCVATLLMGIPNDGGSADKPTFEKLIRMAFQGGLVAATKVKNEN